MLLGMLWLLWCAGELLVRLAAWSALNVALPLAAVWFLVAAVCSLTAGRCTSTRRMDGKTVIITGANAGIGLETAKDLAMRGARVILACRSVERAERAKEEIVRETEAPSENVVVKQLDLASLKSVRRFAEDVLETESRLDVLINNAGLADPGPMRKTEDGLEYNMACNHLGHFLLTHLLLDLLKKSTPSRIVVVASTAHVYGDLSPQSFEAGRGGWKTYGDTKLANIIFAQELAKRLPQGVTVNSLHPGVVSTNFLQHHPPAARKLGELYLSVFKSPQEGAQTTIHLAVSKDVEGVTGKYFADCKPARIWSRQPFDPVLCQKIWELSEKLTGVSKKEN